MPIYEYRRPDGTTFEIQQSFAEEALQTDPDTGVPVERVMHAPAIHFKGKGFYNTDYGTRNRQRETAAQAESSSSKDSSSKDSASKDSSSEKTSSGGDGSSSPSDGKAKPEKGSGGSGKSKDSKPVASKN